MQVGESLKRFGILRSNHFATDILVASIHKGAPDVSLLPITFCTSLQHDFSFSPLLAMDAEMRQEF